MQEKCPRKNKKRVQGKVLAGFTGRGGKQGQGVKRQDLSLSESYLRKGTEKKLKKRHLAGRSLLYRDTLVIP